MARIRGKAKTRERPLGAAIGLGLAAILAVGGGCVAVQLALPGTVTHNFFQLSLHNPSATLPLDPLYQQWLGQIQEEEALLWTPLSLLCGGLTLGWFAPSYVSCRRLLWSGAALSFGILAVLLTFQWSTAVIQQNTLNAHEGGQQVVFTAPPEYILHQGASGAAWIAVTVLGTWLGRMWRGRGRSRQSADATHLQAAGRERML